MKDLTTPMKDISMSLYANYITERTNDLIVETAEGFATYRYMNDGKSVYVIDIYTIPAARRAGYAFYLGDKIVAEAKLKGCTELLGTVQPSTRNSTDSIKFLIAYGMSISSSTNDFLVFRKDI